MEIVKEKNAVLYNEKPYQHYEVRSTKVKGNHFCALKSKNCMNLNVPGVLLDNIAIIKNQRKAMQHNILAIVDSTNCKLSVRFLLSSMMEMM